MIRVISLLAVLYSAVAFGQVSTERIAMNNLAKGKWEKAKARLVKTLKKDSLNATARYLLASYFFIPGNPSYHIDSAYHHIRRALSDYTLSSQRQRDKIRKFPLDSTVIIQQRNAIESAAFNRAKQINTELAYISFIQNFEQASQIDRAKELRDEVAYIDALRENTYASFHAFMTKYPQASRINDARVRYEKLLYEEMTRDRKLASYVLFYTSYPESPYRAEVELQIFEISTASGKPSAFNDFIKQYPKSKLLPKARNILYYLLKEEGKIIPSSLLTDSIKTMRQFEQGYLAPYFKDGKFGFMNAHGEEIIRPQVNDIPSDYKCGNISEELLITDNKIIARNGAVIFTGSIRDTEDLGNGYVLVVGKECSSLIHKSGFVIDTCIQDASVLADSYLAIKKNNFWSIKTLTGLPLEIGNFEEIEAFDDVLVFKQSGKYTVVDKAELGKTADQNPVTFSRPYDEVRRWGNAMLWVRAGEMQGLLTMDLKEKVSLAKKEINPAFFGAIVKSANGYKFWSQTAGETDTYSAVRVQKPWVGGKKDGKWKLLDKNLKVFSTSVFDSIYMVGPFCLGIRGDSSRVYVSPATFIPVNDQARVQFLPGRDSTYYLLITDRTGKTVYNSAGEKLFTAAYDKLEYAGENLFIATLKERKGLINLRGKIVVPLEYDFLGNLNNGTLAVLKDKKFGYLDVRLQKEIKPVYDKNVVPFNSTVLIAFKGGYYGGVDWNNKTILPFEYEEIRYWNDSSALVKRNFQWIIYNFIDKKVIADKIRNFKWLKNEAEEKILIVQQENNYGVISNRKGFILPATYSDIINLGSAAQPLYFTEKHVEEASIYVVIYYDELGKLLRRQVFEVNDYERIYCTQH